MSTNRALQDASKKCVSDAEELSINFESQREASEASGLPPAIRQAQTEPIPGECGRTLTIPPSPPLRNDAVAGPDDDEAGIQAFDAALVRHVLISWSLDTIRI